MIRNLLILLAPLLVGATDPAPADDRSRERAAMVLAVANMAEIANVREARQLSPRALTAMGDVPRHLFVPPEFRHAAYRNEPLPIGNGQTISQPYIVALMTHLLEVEPGHRVLEVGTGSGYQAAVLSMLAGEVRSIEIVEPLAREAGARLRELGYTNVTVRAGDGYAGWPERAPFDRIIVTAGAPHIPLPLVEQLRPGGRMVIPVTRPGGEEELLLVTKDGRGRVRSRSVLPVRFVPLTRPAG
ncbi:MAG TPA: protein-L-isoaspartate(D-aspartate) O-methyltransferase [Allosphingosinicella sp.]|jgi:protein-L-isoaspartate(D-aspartate) O-methyltransferase